MIARQLIAGTVPHRLLSVALQPGRTRDLLSRLDGDGGALACRTTVASALRRLVRHGWLVIVTPAPHGTALRYARTPAGDAALSAALPLLAPTHVARLLNASSALPRPLAALVARVDPARLHPASAWARAARSNVARGHLSRDSSGLLTLTPAGEAELDRLYRVARIVQAQCVGYRAAERIEQDAA